MFDKMFMCWQKSDIFSKMSLCGAKVQNVVCLTKDRYVRQKVHVLGKFPTCSKRKVDVFGNFLEIFPEFVVNARFSVHKSGRFLALIIVILEHIMKWLLLVTLMRRTWRKNVASSTLKLQLQKASKKWRTTWTSSKLDWRQIGPKKHLLAKRKKAWLFYKMLKENWPLVQSDHPSAIIKKMGHQRILHRHRRLQFKPSVASSKSTRQLSRHHQWTNLLAATIRSIIYGRSIYGTRRSSKKKWHVRYNHILRAKYYFERGDVV